jgi:hypothetical protein
MNKLTKAQKDEFATTFAILALYDGGVSCSDTTVCRCFDEMMSCRCTVIVSMFGATQCSVLPIGARHVLGNLQRSLWPELGCIIK